MAAGPINATSVPLDSKARPPLSPRSSAATSHRPPTGQASTSTRIAIPMDAAKRLFWVLVASRMAEGITAQTTAASIWILAVAPRSRATSDAATTQITNARSCG